MIPRLTRASNNCLQAEQFLNEHPNILDKAFTDGCPKPNIQLAIDQPQYGKLKGSASRFRNFNLWYDGELAFVLTHSDQPIASIAIRMGTDFLRIEQIQGVRGAKILYDLGRWEHALVRTVESFAKATQAIEVQILPAEENFWAKEYLLRIKRTGEPPPRGFTPEKIKRRYDDVATFLDYKYDDSKKMFRKPVAV